MAIVLPPAAPTKTGLELRRVAKLSDAQAIGLQGWHTTVAGDDNGRLWLPGAIRGLPLEVRLELAADERLDADWKERERQRVREDVAYMVEAYGHVAAGGVGADDAGGGPPIPFRLWPRMPEAIRKAVGARDQREVLELLRTELLLVILKARQLGLTWLALHYGYHVQAFDPAMPNADVLGLSQDGGYAKRLLERVRRINRLMPPYLRHAESRETRESKTEFRLVGRGRFISLPGTPDAPRSYQAELGLVDEAAFIRNDQAGPTLTALLPACRQIVAISSGNGPPEQPGKGQAFAKVWTEAHDGRNGWRAVFLPTSTHPGRNADWRANEHEKYPSEEEALAEHPESPGDALIGAGKDRYFRLAYVNAAVTLGAELDALLGTEDMPDPVDEGLVTCGDYGDVTTAGYVIWPLEGGGFYVPPSEVVIHQGEAEEIAKAVHRAVAELQEVSPRTGRVLPPIRQHRFDNAGKQTNRSYMAIARARYAHMYEANTPRSHGVRFSDSKRETAGFHRRLFKRTWQGRRTGVVAISPANVELVRQYRGLESAPDGLWKKEDDHGPDAIVAGTDWLAARHRGLYGDEDDE